MGPRRQNAWDVSHLVGQNRAGNPDTCIPWEGSWGLLPQNKGCWKKPRLPNQCKATTAVNTSLVPTPAPQMCLLTMTDAIGEGRVLDGLLQEVQHGLEQRSPLRDALGP